MEKSDIGFNLFWPVKDKLPGEQQHIITNS